MSDDSTLELYALGIEAEDHIEHGRFYKAIEIYQYILIRYADDNLATERAHACLGEVLLTIGRTDEGENHIRKALSYDLENHRYHYLLGFIYGQKYEWENAIQEYRLALDCEPWNRGYQRALGKATFNSGDKKKGLEYLHKVAPFYPDNPGMLAELATAYMSLGDIETARLYAGKAVKVRPDDIMAWAVLKKAYVLGNGTSNGATS